MAKMDTINALDSSAPPAIKKRVRKPRAKPPAKTDTPVQQNNRTVGKNEMAEEKATTQTATKNSKPKRSRPKKSSPVTSSAPPSQEQNINTVEDRPAASTLSSSKPTPQKEKRKKDVTQIEEKTDETSEPKKKKKKKEKKILPADHRAYRTSLVPSV